MREVVFQERPLSLLTFLQYKLPAYGIDRQDGGALAETAIDLSDSRLMVLVLTTLPL